MIDYSAYGASYITLPRAMPPDPKANSWLEAEGILGFAWGGGKWFVSDAAQRLLGGGSSMPGLKARRDIRSPKKGQVYAQSPRSEVYPNRIEYNSTTYVPLEGQRSFMYINHDTGATLNLTDHFI